ncbi:ATP-dependent dethiobiotin synthetase BioD 1 [Rubripirellula lacrimiformis]|uniref:ATP-dependent dethiobiotin synthetase BioD n=1 Tax=Rubripirellula lacrimiformis TaxID=1930273 RepID=A0A517N855_9BACT|nr:dethiobiotin synthase [Rubripirellula lacrimiformis]QDT03188.1 ATP-dependent dethiobiotin synthetase BioD 1 [Rubripirellula lacrimiformis]
MTSPHGTPPTLFFAGTDTDVGKTYVACLVTKVIAERGRVVGVYKPVASGCREVDGVRIADDAVALAGAAGCPDAMDVVCPQRFLAPLAPPAAAAAEGRGVDSDLLFRGADAWAGNCDALIIEGAGGLFSPLADGVLNIDLALKFDGCKLIIVAANRLGAIHQTLATIAAARHRGLNPDGVILCDPTGQTDGSIDGNADQIARYTDVPILAVVPYQSLDADCVDAGSFDDVLGGLAFTNFIDALFMQ